MVPFLAISGGDGLRIQRLRNRADTTSLRAKRKDAAKNMSFFRMRHQHAVEVRVPIGSMATGPGPTAKLCPRLRRSGVGPEANTSTDQCLSHRGFCEFRLCRDLLQTHPESVQI